MASDRHNGFLKNAVIRERIERFSQNLTHKQKITLVLGVTSKDALLKIQDGGRPPYWNSIQYHNLQSASLIFEKFDMGKNIFVMLVTFNTRYLRVRDGD
jgi:hypothetical protein